MGNDQAPSVCRQRPVSARWRPLGKLLPSLVPATGLGLLLACQDPGNPSTPIAPAGDSDAPTVSGIRLIQLPTLSGRTSEAIGINPAGTLVVGYAWERGLGGTIRAVKWTLQGDGSWLLTVLPHAGSATGAAARGAGSAAVAGNDFPGSTSDAVYWPATGGFEVLGCDGEAGSATVYGISTNGQIVVGGRSGFTPGRAAVWRRGRCVENLPPLAPGAGAVAYATNGDGTIVGGSAALTASGVAFPARWKWASGQWVAEQLDQRRGGAQGANGGGDLAGRVVVRPASCATADGCQRAAIWYLNGTTRTLGTLGGDHSWARDINAQGEVVGASTSSRGDTGYFWSASTGMIELPTKGGCCSAANGVSDVRSDGSRVAAGIDLSNTARAVVWVLR